MLRRVLVLVIVVIAVWELFPGVRTGLRAFAKRVIGGEEAAGIRIEVEPVAVPRPLRLEEIMPILRSAPPSELQGGSDRDREALIRKVEEALGGNR